MLNILLIDDEPNLIRDMLRIYGNDVELALNGIEGTQKLQGSTAGYDLIILDIVMPRMDGWEVLKYIRTNPVYLQIPVIMLTSCREDRSLVKGLHRGADIYL